MNANHQVRFNVQVEEMNLRYYEQYCQGQYYSGAPTSTSTGFYIKIDVSDFRFNELRVRATTDHAITVEANYQWSTQEGACIIKKFFQRVPIPKQFNIYGVLCYLEPTGILTVTAPRREIVPDPEYYINIPVPSQDFFDV